MAKPYEYRSIEAELQRAQDEMERPYYNPSLAMAVSQRLGPGNQWAFDPRVKHSLRTPYDTVLRGATTQAEGQSVKMPFYSDPFDTYLDRFDLQPGHVYAFGEKPEPDAAVLAHEYRHRAGVADEYPNRIADAMYAQTPEDWEKAVQDYRDLRFQNSGLSEILPTEKAEAELLAAIEKWKPDLLRNEFRESIKHGEHPYPLNDTPSLGGFLSYMFGGFGEDYYAMRSQLPYEKAAKESQQRRTLQETADLFGR